MVLQYVVIEANAKNVERPSLVGINSAITDLHIYEKTHFRITLSGL